MKKIQSKPTHDAPRNNQDFNPYTDIFFPEEIDAHIQELDLIYEVTDLGIDREMVFLEVLKDGAGSIVRKASGIIEINLPETGSIQEFLQRLQGELEDVKDSGTLN